MSVRERFIQLMEEKNFSQTQFSKESGYTINATNKFLTGRTTSPKIDFIEAVKKAWPEVNLNWLIMGEGPKYLNKGLPDPEDNIAQGGEGKYVTKEEFAEYKENMKLFDQYMDKIERIVKWYIQKELIPKVREFDPEAADEAEILLRDIVGGE